MLLCGEVMRLGPQTVRIRQKLSRGENRTVRQVRVRIAAIDDAPAMGRVMVESFLAAHRGQMPEAAFQKRVDEWTPEVSATGWSRVLEAISDGNRDRDVVLVAEDDDGLVGLVCGGAAEGGAADGTTCEIGALYVHPGHLGHGIGRALLRAAAQHLADLGYHELHIGVLSANNPARDFYEAMGGREIGQGLDDEEGHLLPLTIYGWADVTDLASVQPESCPPAARRKSD